MKGTLEGIIEHNLLDRILNKSSSEAMAFTRLKRLITYCVSGNKIGQRVLISPDCRIYNSEIGDDAILGIGVKINNSKIGKESRIGVEAHIENCEVGEGCVITPNSIITKDIPDNHLAHCYNKCKPIPNNPNGNRLLYFNRSPGYYWASIKHPTINLRSTFFSAGIRQAFVTYIPRFFKSSDVKVKIAKDFYSVGENVSIHYSAILDPTFRQINIGDNVKIGKNAKILTHTFVNIESAFSFKYGPVSIGDNVEMEPYSVILPRTDVPKNVILPERSIASKRGVRIFEGRLVSYKSLIK